MSTQKTKLHYKYPEETYSVRNACMHCIVLTVFFLLQDGFVVHTVLGGGSEGEDGHQETQKNKRHDLLFDPLCTPPLTGEDVVHDARFNLSHDMILQTEDFFRTLFWDGFIRSFIGWKGGEGSLDLFALIGDEAFQWLLWLSINSSNCQSRVSSTKN